MIVCPSCGERSPDEFRFCPACATALTDAAPQESRKTVTIVFSDLVGSTALGERLDPEALREVLDRYFDEMRTALERHGGTVEKYIGDAVMAVFGLPRAHEDDALRAVRAAWDMRGALAALNDELETRWGATLHNRTGVSTGEVVAGDAATAQRLVTGDTVNTAARLEQAAPTDEILIGEPTFRLVKGVVQVEDVDPLALKGKAAEVIAFRLVGVDPVSRGMVGANPLVGRSEELARLRGTLARVATDQRCELVTIVGEPGTGKSRLVAEFLDEAATTARVLSGRCLPYGESITFWPLAEVVRDAAGISEADSAEEAKALLAAIGGGLERADQVLVAVGSAIGLTSAAIPMQEIFWATRRLFEHLARERPLVVALDDLQWAEPTFLELVTEVVRLSEHAPLLIIGQARPELLEDHPEWAASVPSTTIFLDALTESEARELATSAIGDAGLPEELVDRLVTAADGNPLFVEQMLSMWVDDGLLRSTSSGWVLEAEPDALPVPDTISALLSARLDRLPFQEREVMQRGSIAGQVFYRGAIVDMAPTISRAKVDDHLSALTGRRLVAPDEATFVGEPAYRFGHLLIRDAAYSGMLKRARADLHERFAGWLERMAGDRLAEYREIVGYHFEQAYRYLSDLGPIDQHGRDVALRAAVHLGAAAEMAATRVDWSATIELLDRAIEILPPDEELSGDLLMDLSQALYTAGELDRMAAVIPQAKNRARALGGRRLQARSQLQEIELGRAKGQSSSQLQEQIRPIVKLFEELDDDMGLADALVVQSGLAGDQGRMAEAFEIASRAGIHAERSGNRVAGSTVLERLHTALVYGPAPVPEAVEACLVKLQQGLPTRYDERNLLSCLAQLFAMAGRFAEARTAVAQQQLLLEEEGSPAIMEAVGRAEAAGNVEMLASDPAAAEAELRTGVEILEAIGERGVLSTQLAWLAAAIFEQGRLDEALSFTERSEQLAASDDILSQVMWRSVRARALAAKGEADTALELARGAIEIADATDFLNLQGDAYMSLAFVLRSMDRNTETAHAAREALERFERKGNVSSAARARESAGAGSTGSR